MQLEYLYLVGDTFEWYHRTAASAEREVQSFTDALDRLASNGTSIFVVPGNHDTQLAEQDSFNGFEVRSNFIHQTATGLSYLVVHGDIFDLSCSHRWSKMERIGGALYPVMLALGELLHRMRKVPAQSACHWCTYWKQLSGRANRHIARFEHFMSDLASVHRCDGVICGHIHRPANKKLGRIHYLNCGDWVEHFSFITENQNGELQLSSAELQFGRYEPVSRRHLALATAGFATL